MFSSKSLRSRKSVTLSALLVLLALNLSCSSNPTDSDKPTGPAALTANPTHAAPGALVAISGATVDTSALASYRLLIGGQQVLLLTDTLGSVSGIAPAFFKDSTSTWPSPSVAPVDIELFKDTVLVGRGVGVFTSDSLIQVPGSTQKLVNNVIATVESYKSILAALPTGPGIQEQLTVAMTAALDSLLYGRGDSSLTALLTDLQANNPEALALLDATYGGDGSTARSQEVADAMAAIAASLNSGVLRRGQVLPDDVRLAAQMQLSSLLKLFGDTFIHGAASTSSDIAFGASWAAYSGAAALPGAQLIIAFAGVTSTVLSIIDLIFNKIMVASMPTVIDSFTITLSTDTISVGDTTVSSLKVYARNSPPQITLGDLLSQFQGIMGLIAPGGGATLLQQLEGTLNYLLGQLNNALQAYAAANPDFSYEPIFFDIAGVPIIHWEAEINDPRLLDLDAPSTRLAVIDSLLEWRSTGGSGSASITIAPSFDQDATLIPIPSFLGYVGSSFGILSDSSAVISPAHQVTIHKSLALLVDFAPTISQNGANVLGVKAGEISFNGDTSFIAGLQIDLTTIGGSASPASGTTDTSGQFNSLISLNPLTDTVEVVVRVTSSFAEFASETVVAVVQQQQGQFTGVAVNNIPLVVLGVSNDGMTIDTLFRVPPRSSQIMWSPDGTQAISRFDHYSNSTGVTAIPSQLHAQYNYRTTSWGPNGSTVYGSAYADSTSRLVPSIVSYQPGGTVLTELYRQVRHPDSTLLISGIEVSPNGSIVAFVEFHTVRQFGIGGRRFFKTVSALGGSLATVLDEELSHLHGSVTKMQWLQDNATVVFDQPVADTSTRPYKRWAVIRKVNVISGSKQTISPTTQSSGGNEYKYEKPCLLNGGSSVLCRRFDSRDGNPDQDLVVLSINGGLQRTIKTFQNASSEFLVDFATSSDGKKLAYVTRTGTNNATSITIVDATTWAVIGATNQIHEFVSVQWRP